MPLIVFKLRGFLRGKEQITTLFLPQQKNSQFKPEEYKCISLHK